MLELIFINMRFYNSNAITGKETFSVSDKWWLLSSILTAKKVILTFLLKHLNLD